MSTLTYNIEEAWMMPNGDSMIFCREKDGFALTELEIDIETDGPGTAWAVTKVCMVDHSVVGRKKYLTGDLRVDAINWIKATMQADIETFIRENYVDPSLDYRDAVRSL